MRTIIAIASLLASISLARADATITFALTGAGAANTSKTLVVSDGDGQRILAWAKDAYGPHVGPPVETNPLVCNVSPTPASCLPTTRPLTNKEAIEAVFAGLFSGLRDNVKSFERNKAAVTASDAVTTVTPK